MANTATPASASALTSNANSSSIFASSSNISWAGISHSATRSSGTTTPTASSYLMAPSPAKPRRPSAVDHYKPKVLKTTGQRPACLVNASVTYCGDDQIYAFGGFDQFTDEVYNHVLRLNLKTLNWALVDNYGDIPGVRMGHSASLYQGNKLLVYGGENEHREYLSDVVILNLEDHHWTQPDIQGPVPRGRARHAAVIYDDKLFIVGGLTGETNYILEDICYLDLKTWTWSRTWSFVGRFDHTAWVWNDRLWVLGGLAEGMERSNEIWWLDLKASPPLGSSTVDSIRSLPPLVETSNATMGDNMSLLTRQDRLDRTVNDIHTANSGSVHIRSSKREKPTAPGAISALKFLSGLHVPHQSYGSHFHVCSAGTLLDFVTPAATITTNKCNMSALELDTLRWRQLVVGAELFEPGFKWHYCTINEEGTKVWLLGSPAEDNVRDHREMQLNQVLAVDLRRYGLLGQDPGLDPSRSLDTSKRGSRHLGADLALMFDQPAQADSMADFTITANLDSDSIDLTDEADDAGPADTRYSTNTTGSQQFVSESSATSPPIHVHKIILHARWPHFRRLYASKMVEYQTQRLHIPEPYSVVRAFLYYLYTDSIAPHPTYCPDLDAVAGMLVMANLYDLPKLRLMCVNRLSKEMDIEHAAVIWERAGRTEEAWLQHRAARFCMMNWGRVVRTEGFKSLSRHSLMELCEVIDTEGRVVGGEELDDTDPIGGFGGVHQRRRPRVPGNEEEMTEADEDEGMEIS